MDQNNQVTANDLGNDVVEETTNAESVQDESIPNSEQTSTQSELPETASDRTKAEFEKLKQRNAEMARRLAELEKKEKYGNNVFDRLIPEADTSHLTNTQVQNIEQNFIDEEGNVDVLGLTNALKRANQEAVEAKKMVASFIQNQKQAEEQRQLKEAYKVSPWLDPNGSAFDQTKYNLARDRLVRYWSEGKAPDLVSVAQEIEKDFASFSTPEKVEQEKAKAVEQVRDDISRRNIASSTPSQKRVAETSLDELRKRTREGDKDALLERLKAI